MDDRMGIGNWDELVRQLQLFWPEVQYLTLRERLPGNRFEALGRLQPRAADDEPPCRRLSLQAEAITGETIDDPEDRATWFRRLADDVLLSVTIQALQHELEQFQRSLNDEPSKVICNLYADGGVPLVSRTLTVPPPPPPRVSSAIGGEVAVGGISLSRAAGAGPVQLADVLNDVDDPSTRLALTALALQSDGFKRVQAAYQDLAGDIASSYRDIHGVTTQMLREMDVVAKSRYQHIENLQKARLHEMSQEINLRRKEVQLNDSPDARTIVDAEVKKEAVGRAMDLGERFLEMVGGAVGVTGAAELGPLLKIIKDDPELAQKLKMPGLAQKLANPEVRTMVHDVFDTLNSIDPDSMSAGAPPPAG